jgi:hypothetical protein
MSRALCPVCRTEHLLNLDGRLALHSRKAESPLLRARGTRDGVPCEGTGRGPAAAPGRFKLACGCWVNNGRIVATAFDCDDHKQGDPDPTAANRGRP